MRLWLVALVLAAAACSQDGVVELRRWTLEAEGVSAQAIDLPAHIDERIPKRAGTFVLTTDVELPFALRDRPLTLTVAALSGIARLRVDGRPAEALEWSVTERYRTKGWHAWRVPPSPGPRLSLALEVDHRWVLSGRFDAVPRLSATPLGDRRYLAVKMFNEVSEVASLAVLLFASSMSFLTWLLDRRRRAHLYFVALSGLSVVPILYCFGRTQIFFDRADTPFTLVVLTLGWIAVVHFVYAQFSTREPRRWWLVPLFVSAGISVFAGEDAIFTGRVFWLNVLLLWSWGTVHLFVYHLRLLARRPRPRFAGFLPIVWFATIVGSWAEMAGWLGYGTWLGGIHPGPISLAFFAGMQAVLLGLERAASFRDADRMNRELEARVGELEAPGREIRTLNDELKRQVVDRSRELDKALASFAAPERVAPSPLAEGAVVEGRYRVVRVIGVGGMGAVYEVERTADRRRLALKVLHGNPTPEDLARLAREAQITAQVAHPAIVSIFDVDVSADGVLYLVMELVDGASLEDSRQHFGDPAWVLPVLRQIAEGLAAMHARGVVHRDLKPANILISETRTGPRVKIGDFGIASLSGELSELITVDPHDDTVPIPKSSLTQTGVIFGTPLYMAPELATGVRDAAPSTDVFSLGIIAYELLTQARPFDEPPLLMQMRGRPPPAPRPLWCEALTEAQLALLERCVSPDAGKRPSAESVAAALGRRS